VTYLGDVSRELQQLRDVLDAQRAGVLKKLAGLNDADARRSTVAAGTILAGLLQHLTFVESRWFEQIVAKRPAARGRRSMNVDPTVSLRTLRAEHRVASEARDATLATYGDADVPVEFDGKARDLPGRSRRSSRKPLGTPGMPTSSANRSTFEQGADRLARAPENTVRVPPTDSRTRVTRHR
jgi:hypothetical protein